MTAIHHFWLGASPYSAVVVSGLFPAYATDGVIPTLAVSGGNLVEMPRPVDSMGAQLGLTSGGLQTVLVGANDLGAIAPALTLTGAALVVGIKSAQISAEAIAPALGLSSGAMYHGLISRTYGPEAVAPTLTLTGGTLT